METHKDINTDQHHQPLDLIDIDRTIPCPTRAKYTLFSSVHGTFTKIDHTLGHKSYDFSHEAEIFRPSLRNKSYFT